MKRTTCLAKRVLTSLIVTAMLVCLLPVPHAQAVKKQPAVKSISIKNGRKTVTKKTITLTVGEKASLKVTVKPAKAKKSIAFKSSRPTVAKVTSKGKITAKKAGTAKITVTVRGKNGKKKTTYMKVKVKAKAKPTPTVIAVTSVTATVSSNQLTVGETAQITANVLPANATDKRLTYASSNTDVATVEQSGKITAKKAGTANITVTAAGGKYARVSVTVKDNIIAVERITAEILPSTTILKGDEAQITAEIFPANATDKSLTYTSSNETVATVDNTGKVTAKATGTSTITVSCPNNKSADISITVAEEYEINTKELEITDGNDRIYGKLYSPKQEGKWPTVILSHGYNNNNEGFKIDCELFAKNGYQAYAYDFCGGSTTSKSSGKSTEMTIFTEKQNLLSVFNYVKSMDSVDPEQIFLLGGSMGGLVTALTAEELTTQVKGMVLYFPALCVADDHRNRFPNESDIPETDNFMDLTLGKVFYTSIRNFYVENEIGNFPNPVLIIWGTEDELVKRSYIDMAMEKYGEDKAKLIVIPNGHHYAGDAIYRESALSFMKEQ